MTKIIFSVTNDIITDQRVYKISHTLAGPGTEITVIGRKLPGSPDIISNKVKYKRFKLLFRKGLLFYMEYNLRLFCYLLTCRADVFVANDLDTLAGNFLAARMRRKKLVYDSHEYFTEVPELRGRHFIKFIWRTIEKIIVPKISISYTVCESLAKIYNEKYGIQMQVVRNLSLCNRDYPVLSRKLQKKDERIILYQGALNKGRGLELAIKAMKYLGNARLVIIGGGDIENELHFLVKNENVNEKVTFIGRVPWQELGIYTRQADIGISLEENLGLNYYYALPNKLFDYIQAKVPVLVSDFPEMRQIVNHYEIGRTILTEDSRELANVFIDMLSNKELIKKWKTNLENAATELCWEIEEIKIKEIFSKITQQETQHSA